MRKRRWATIPQSVCDRVKRLCAQYGDQQVVADLCGLSQSQVSEIKARGFKEAVIRPPRAMPPDFPIMAHRLKAKELCAHYRAGYRTVSRWRSELSNPPASRRGDHFRGKRTPRARPGDFAELSARLTIEELKAHYRAGAATIARWFAEIPNPRPKWNGRNRPTERTHNGAK